MKSPRKPRKKKMAECGGIDEPYVVGVCEWRSCSLFQFDVFSESGRASDHVCVTTPDHALELADYLTRWAGWARAKRDGPDNANPVDGD